MSNASRRGRQVGGFPFQRHAGEVVFLSASVTSLQTHKSIFFDTTTRLPGFQQHNLACVNYCMSCGPPMEFIELVSVSFVFSLACSDGDLLALKVYLFGHAVGWLSLQYTTR